MKTPKSGSAEASGIQGLPPWPRQENGAPESEQQPIPAVTIRVEGEAAEFTRRRPRQMSQAQIERRDALMMAQATDASPDLAEEQATPPAAPPARDTGPALLEAAQDVHDARAALTGIDSKLSELRAKSDDLNELKVATAAARELRTKLLGDALLAGKKADLAAVDKQCEVSARVLERRQDEIVAVERATATLEAQREAAKASLAELEATYNKRREEHLQAMRCAGALAETFCKAVGDAQACVSQMPTAHFRERLLSTGVRVSAEGSEQLQSASALRQLVISQALVDLSEADKCAAIVPADTPVRTLGYIWMDGTIHQDPEPKRADLPEGYKAGMVSVQDSTQIGVLA